MQAPPPGTITIGELARETGLTPATLRTWEARHGFPVPVRLASGHRRYHPGTVPAVRAVLRRQAAGVRLEAAIAEAGQVESPTPSVYAELRRSHPELPCQVLRKSTLVALSHAIEDECVARADHAVLFGAFQRPRHLRASLSRWEDLARSARATFAFVADPGDAAEDSRIARVPIAERAPMRREWAVVCDGTGLPVALSAWELPGQDATPDADRRFETLWTLEPAAVRVASRVCARMGAEAGVQGASAVLEELEASPGAGADLAAGTRLFARVLGYVEQREG